MTKQTKKFDPKALRQKVLDTDDIINDTFYVKDWDVELPVRTISAAEIKQIMKYKNDEIRMMILAVLYGCKTPEGESVFAQEDLAAFETKKSFGPISKLGKKILEISGLGNDAVAQAKND